MVADRHLLACRSENSAKPHDQRVVTLEGQKFWYWVHIGTICLKITRVLEANKRDLFSPFRGSHGVAHGFIDLAVNILQKARLRLWHFSDPLLPSFYPALFREGQHGNIFCIQQKALPKGSKLSGTHTSPDSFTTRLSATCYQISRAASSTPRNCHQYNATASSYSAVQPMS